MTHTDSKTVRWGLTETALAHMMHAKGKTVMTKFYKQHERSH